MPKNLTVFYYLARSIFPSWKFFEELKYVIRLQWKLEETFSESPSSFCMMKKSVNKKNLFINSQINLHLAKLSWLERFVVEASEADPEKIKDLVTYKFIEQWVIEEYLSLNPDRQLVSSDSKLKLNLKTPLTNSKRLLRFRILIFEEDSKFSEPVVFLTSNLIEVVHPSISRFKVEKI